MSFFAAADVSFQCPPADSSQQPIMSDSRDPVALVCHAAEVGD